jgi:tagatose 1,6-diphosphate aldolase
MSKVKMSKGKFAGLNACADERGVIAALAVDHRGNLLEAIAKARGPQGQADADDMLTFKSAVTRILTPHASAILLDPEYGLEAIASRAPGRGVLLAYEQSGYDTTIQGRLPDLLPEWSVRRLVEAGAQAIKILMYYNPFDIAQINTIKQAYVERIGAECAALDVPFFLEPLAYDDVLGDDKGLAFARKKPEYVTRAMEEFSRPRYGVDVLKVEIPVNPAYVSGLSAFSGGEYVFTRQEAMEWFRAAANSTSKPFIFLSAGVTNAVFCELLELAAEAGVQCAGILCGRATWQDGISIYAKEGSAALERWLEHEGVQHVRALNAVLEQSAMPWWNTYGGRDNVEIV